MPKHERETQAALEGESLGHVLFLLTYFHLILEDWSLNY